MLNENRFLGTFRGHNTRTTVVKTIKTSQSEKRQQIGTSSYNFLASVWNITNLPHRIELTIPKNRIVFLFRFCYILAGKSRANFVAKKLNTS
jgi:hypothetical protein